MRSPVPHGHRSVRRPLVLASALALLLVPLVWVPISMAQETPLQPIGPHTIQMSRGGLDTETHVFETLYFSNGGESDFEGTVTFRLDDGAGSVIASFWALNVSDNQRVPAERNAGGTNGADWQTAEEEGFLVHRVDLGDVGLTIARGQAVGVDLRYSVAAADTTLQRGFTHDASDLTVSAQLPSGLVPRSDDVEFAHLGGSLYRTTGETASFAANEVFEVRFETTDVPATPLAVELASTGSDAGTLRAQASGGIGDYTYTWFLDGQELEDETGPTLQVDDTLEGSHTYRVLVRDSADPPATAESRFLLRATTSGDAVGPLPGGEAGLSAVWAAVLGALIGAAVLYGLVMAGLVGGRPAAETRPSGGTSIAAESKEMLELRKRTNMAALKELELAKKKGEVSEGQYLPLKEELKARTVKIMRELERRQTETV